MNLQQMALILTISAVLTAPVYADAIEEHADTAATPSAQSVPVGPKADDVEVAAGAQSSSTDPATPAAPAEPAVEPEKGPSCSGVANCAGQVVKGVVGGIIGVAAAVLYLGLATGLIFLL